jgi:tRNA(fMet)-specific endonuclease VapC
MGVIIDTSTLVTAERRKHNVGEIFTQLREAFGEAEAGLSAVTLVELAHGIERAELDAHRVRRQAFLDDLISDIEIFPVKSEIALLAGKISGQQARHGINLPFEDLLIGATALHHGC